MHETRASYALASMSNVIFTETFSDCTACTQSATGIEGPREEGEECGEECGGEWGEEDEWDDVWLAPPPVHGDAQPAVAMNGVRRKRKRNGQVVDKSAFFYSIYKKSRRALKKAGLYYVGSAEDRCSLDTIGYLHDWVQTRHYQCRFFAHHLRDHARIPADVAEACMFEIEAVLDCILANARRAKQLDLGNAWLWVAMLVQQHMSLKLNKPYVFDDVDVVNRWSLNSLNEDMRRKPKRESQYGSTEQRMTVQPEDFVARLPHEHARAGKHFCELMGLAKPATQYNPIRTAAKENADANDAVPPPWLYERIVNAEKAQQRTRGIFGDTILVDVQ